MPGTRSNANPVRTVLVGYSSAAVTASQNLLEHVVLFPARIGAIKAYAETAGTGGGNTVLDVTINGTTAFTTAGNKPTLAATSTGEFANVNPEVRGLMPGDRVRLMVASISTTGHARLNLSVALELQ